ncbi:2-keto-4-pentenoate hydratase [Tistrella mobilis]|uniref:2-keto-4-pentenoate hydratase n=1 Tax=Tistrella mobilis TaxID=171437 RepID=UPI00355656E4
MPISFRLPAMAAATGLVAALIALPAVAQQSGPRVLVPQAPVAPTAPAAPTQPGVSQPAGQQPPTTRPASVALPPKVAEEAERLGRAWLARIQPKAPEVKPDLAQAYAAQDRFLAAAMPSRPAQLGWKLTLTARTTQEMFGARAPVVGRIFAGQILENGADVPRDVGARPTVEVDLAVTVKDAGIMQATNPLEVAAHLATVSAYIDVPDLLLASGEPLNAETLAMINAGMRTGVVGKAVPVQPTPEFVAAMAEMQVKALDGHGGLIVESRSSAIMGQPLNALVWLIGHLKARGESLKPGDLITLGAISRPLPLKEGQVVRAVYTGLPGGPLEAQLSVK